jgi:hypothetical protein
MFSEEEQQFKRTITRNSFLIFNAYAPTGGKKYFKGVKKFQHKIGSYISRFYAHVKFRRKPTFFMSDVKKIKKSLAKRSQKIF